MTPKDKAKQLVESMAFSCRECANAKLAALIAVNQLIEYQDYFMDYVRMDLPSNVVAGLPYKYWDKVKKELEAL